MSRPFVPCFSIESRFSRILTLLVVCACSFMFADFSVAAEAMDAKEIKKLKKR